MGTFLFNETIFGPVKSRRLGISLGINILPNNRKVCNFDCIYCECGRTLSQNYHEKIPAHKWIISQLEKRLRIISENKELLDTITFAGNGEPTLHPEFSSIIDDTRRLRNKYLPNVKIAVLSNATMIDKPNVFSSLQKIDYNILKLDSVNPALQKRINCPLENFVLSNIFEKLKDFKGNLMIQCMFFKGKYKNKILDNSIDDEVIPLIKTIREINPHHIMIYTIERDTPVDTLGKISKAKLDNIAEMFKTSGLRVSVSY